MTGRLMRAVVVAGAMMVASTAAMAQGAPAATPWALASDTGYAFESNGKFLTYKMGTNNAKYLLKGAKKVPKNTLFFVGENGQLYMRTGRYLEGDGRFSFGPS